MTLLAVALAACGTPAGDGGAVSTTVTEPDPTTTLPADTTTTTIGETEMPEESQVVEAALADLADREGVAVEDISVVQVREVDWPDTAIGCPEEGMSYAQMVVPGFQVILQVDERVFDYHAGGDGAVFLCPSEEKDGGYDFVPPPGIDT